MGEVVGAGLLAHVPTIVLPEAERLALNEGREISLVPGLERLRREVIDVLRPDTVVLLDSHWATTVEFVVTAHEHRSGLLGQCLGSSARRVAAHFFVRHQKHCDGPPQSAMPRLQRSDRVEHECDARLHVEHAGSVQAPIGDVTGHGRERSQWIDGVEVPQQQDWLGLFFAREINLQVVRIVFGAVHAGPSAYSFESSCEEGAHAVGSGLVIAGRFDLHKLADHLHDLLLPGFEIAQPFAPYRVYLECFGWFLLRACSFFARHLSAHLPPWCGSCLRAQVVQYNLQAVLRRTSLRRT